MKTYRIKRVQEQRWVGASMQIVSGPKRTEALQDFEKAEEQPISRCITCTVLDNQNSYELFPQSDFEIGYHGAGPSDLALAILTDYLKINLENIETFPPLSHDRRKKLERPLKYFKDFRHKFIAPLKLGVGECYEITEQQIRNWLFN